MRQLREQEKRRLELKFMTNYIREHIVKGLLFANVAKHIRSED